MFIGILWTIARRGLGYGRCWRGRNPRRQTLQAHGRRPVGFATRFRSPRSAVRGLGGQVPTTAFYLPLSSPSQLSPVLLRPADFSARHLDAKHGVELAGI